jgi:hypothetical protein
MSTEMLPISGFGLKDQPDQSYVESKIFSCEEAVESSDRPSQALNDRYRCPENFFDLAVDEKLSSSEGYFRFGPNAICYGRSAVEVGETHVSSSLHDALGDTSIDNGKLRLPFDPTDILDNLRQERYAKREGMGSYFQNLLRRLYYLVRPLTTLSIRRQVQRFRTRNWKKLSFPQWPVDTTVENLCERLLLLSMHAQGVDRVPFVWFWPDGARGCLMMTHDVETETGKAFCENLMDIDDAFGIKASFNIVPERRYAVSAEFIELIRNRGFGVEVQDLNHDGRLFDSREEFLRRAKIINRYAREYSARGFRAGVLYRNPEWYHALDFSFDMSIPNVAHLDPQRGGCCTVMPYFIGDILELPVTTTQDYMLFHLLNQRSIDLWKTQIELIMEKNGLASFIVHPDYLMQPDTRSVYEDLLGYLLNLCEKRNVWSALPSDIDGWWRARSKMQLERDGDSWQIVGEGAHRAVLAYAKNVDGNLVYELANTPRATCAGDHDTAPLA